MGSAAPFDAAALDPVVAGTPQGTGATPNTPLGVAGSTATLPQASVLPQAASADRVSDLPDLTSVAALSPSEQVKEIARRYERLWRRAYGSGGYTEALKTVELLLEQLVTHPDDLTSATKDAATQTFMALITDTWSYLAGVARWALQMSRCAEAVDGAGLLHLAMGDWAALQADLEACAWVKDFVAKTLHLLHVLDHIEQEAEAWAQAVAEQPDLLLVAVVALEDAEYQVLDRMLGDQTLYGWLRARAAQGPTELGRLIGTVLGFLAFQGLWLALGEWAGEMGVIGEWLWELANAPLPTLPSDQAQTNLQLRSPAMARPTAAATSGAVETAVSPEKLEEELAHYLDALGPEGRRLLREIVAAARQAEGSLSRIITDSRLRAIIQAVGNDPALAEAARAVQTAVESAFGRAHYAYGPHSLITRWTEYINRGANTLPYLGSIADGVTRLDRAQEVTETVALLTKVVDGAHAIDQRGWKVVKPAFQRAGIPWETESDIFSMILTQDEHRGNALRALERTAGLPRGSLDKPEEWNSFTGLLIKRIKFVDKLPTSPAAEVEYYISRDTMMTIDEAGKPHIDPTTAHAVITAHESVALKWAKSIGSDFEAIYKPRCQAMYDEIRSLITTE